MGSEVIYDLATWLEQLGLKLTVIPLSPNDREQMEDKTDSILLEASVAESDGEFLTLEEFLATRGLTVEDLND
jgi:hypothetical protein